MERLVCGCGVYCKTVAKNANKNVSLTCSRSNNSVGNCSYAYVLSTSLRALFIFSALKELVVNGYQDALHKKLKALFAYGWLGHSQY